MLHWTHLSFFLSFCIRHFAYYVFLDSCFLGENWLRLCTNNSRSKCITEINYIEHQRFISWSFAPVIWAFQRNEQGEKCTGKPEWFTQAKFPVQRGIWGIVAFCLKHTQNCRDLGRWDSLFTIWQSLFPLPVHDMADLGWEPQTHRQLSPGWALLQPWGVGEGDYWAIIHCPGSSRIML